jgi:two-component sensor histidine kinase
MKGSKIKVVNISGRQIPGIVTNSFYVLFLILFIFSLWKSASPYDPKQNSQLDILRLVITNVFVSLGGIWFIGIWKKSVLESTEFRSKKNIRLQDIDFGLVFISGAMLCWDIGVVVELIIPQKNNSDGKDFEYATTLVSSFNSLFFLLSLKYFIHSQWWFKLVRIFSTKEKFNAKILWYTVITIGLMSVSYYKNVNSWFFRIELLDAALLGIPTILGLGFVLSETFIKRKLYAICVFTILILLFTLLVQFWKADILPISSNSYPNFGFLVNIIYKLLMVLVFYSLAFSWSQEKLENVNKELENVNKELENVNKELENVNKELENVNNRLTSSIANLDSKHKELVSANEKLASINYTMNHSIKNNLYILSDGANQIITKFKEVIKENGLTDDSLIQLAEAKLVKHKVLIQIHELSYDTKDIKNAFMFFEKLINLLKKALDFEDDQFEFINMVNADLKIIAQKKIDLGIVIRELLTNAKKYSRIPMKIKLQLITVTEDNQNIFIIKVEDNASVFDITKLKTGGLADLEERIKNYSGLFSQEIKKDGKIINIKLQLKN